MITDIILQREKQSGGHCGTYATEIMQHTGKDWQTVRSELNSMYKEKLIKTRPGAHGKLIFPTKKLLQKNNRLKHTS